MMVCYNEKLNQENFSRHIYFNDCHQKFAR